jgi:hypothetical protein
VSIQDTPQGTSELLSKVLGGGSEVADGSSGSSRAAQLLAQEIHRDMLLDVTDEGFDDIPENLGETYGDIGIWIDPIGKHVM